MSLDIKMSGGGGVSLHLSPARAAACGVIFRVQGKIWDRRGREEKRERCLDAPAILTQAGPAARSKWSHLAGEEEEEEENKALKP